MATSVAPTSREAAGTVRRHRGTAIAIACRVAGAIAVAVIVAVTWFIVTSGKRKEEFASRSLNQARETAEAGNLPLASSELQKLIQTYKGTDAANEAVITLNEVRLVNGQGELAAVGLRDFLATKPAAKYVAPANGLLGASLENSGKWADAGDAFSRASRGCRRGIPQGALSAGRGTSLHRRRQRRTRPWRPTAPSSTSIRSLPA